jgi:hypothetical protein
MGFRAASGDVNSVFCCRACAKECGFVTVHTVNGQIRQLQRQLLQWKARAEAAEAALAAHTQQAEK